MHRKYELTERTTRMTTITIEKGQTNLLLCSTRLHNVLTQQNALAIHLFPLLCSPSVNKAHYFQTKEPCEKWLQTMSETWSHIDIMNNFNCIPHTGPVALNVTWVSEQHTAQHIPNKSLRSTTQNSLCAQLQLLSITILSSATLQNYFLLKMFFLVFKRKKKWVLQMLLFCIKIGIKYPHLDTKQLQILCTRLLLYFSFRMNLLAFVSWELQRWGLHIISPNHVPVYQTMLGVLTHLCTFLHLLLHFPWF